MAIRYHLSASTDARLYFCDVLTLTTDDRGEGNGRFRDRSFPVRSLTLNHVGAYVGRKIRASASCNGE